MNTEPFEVWISNGSVLEWLVIAIAPTIPKPIQWKSKQNGSDDLEQNGRHFVENRMSLEKGTPLENQTGGYHWNPKSVWYSSTHCISIYNNFNLHAMKVQVF